MTDQVFYRGWLERGQRRGAQQQLVASAARLVVPARSGPVVVDGIARLAFARAPREGLDDADGWRWGALVAYDTHDAALVVLPLEPWGDDETGSVGQELARGSSLATRLADAIGVPLQVHDLRHGRDRTPSRAPEQPTPVRLADEQPAALAVLSLLFVLPGVPVIVAFCILAFGRHRSAGPWWTADVLLTAVLVVALVARSVFGRRRWDTGEELARPAPSVPVPRGLLDARIGRRDDRLLVTDLRGRLLQLPLQAISRAELGGGLLTLNEAGGRMLLAVPVAEWFDGSDADARAFAARLGVACEPKDRGGDASGTPFPLSAHPRSGGPPEVVVAGPAVGSFLGVLLGPLCGMPPAVEAVGLAALALLIGLLTAGWVDRRRSGRPGPLVVGPRSR